MTGAGRQRFSDVCERRTSLASKRHARCAFENVSYLKTRAGSRDPSNPTSRTTGQLKATSEDQTEGSVESAKKEVGLSRRGPGACAPARESKNATSLSPLLPAAPPFTAQSHALPASPPPPSPSSALAFALATHLIPNFSTTSRMAEGSPGRAGTGVETGKWMTCRMSTARRIEKFESERRWLWYCTARSWLLLLPPKSWSSESPTKHCPQALEALPRQTSAMSLFPRLSGCSLVAGPDALYLLGGRAGASSSSGASETRVRDAAGILRIVSPASQITYLTIDYTNQSIQQVALNSTSPGPFGLAYMGCDSSNNTIYCYGGANPADLRGFPAGSSMLSISQSSDPLTFQNFPKQGAPALYGNSLTFLQDAAYIFGGGWTPERAPEILFVHGLYTTVPIPFSNALKTENLFLL
ncbi:hypothetical protein BDK51DRAFT_46085 [Blyttiomyces helicus]|uniref:Uncharacterized protein n=1 Tax=Blyttiomyces helicus TaxID=388810 RepID=A0A4P9WE87_9FUNG|nr:hypothetical protein BDK51DRAFT_46085 [Blyttiomyces helicus]|eukprot:RKO91031.1 hypothetical protein BDK51DRAFT_46085 [Blyttiomyces helicus]